MNRRHLISVGLAIAAGAALVLPAAAQGSYPERPIKLIVPSGPGGGYDVTARLVGQSLSRQLGQPVVIENRVGAAGTLGAAQVAKSAPDGYTLLWGGNGPLTLTPILTKNAGYDPTKSFIPVSLGAVSSYALVVPANSPLHSVKDLIGRGKSKPDQLTYASNGANGGPHLLGEVLTSVAGFKALHVPYKGGTESVTAVVAGNVSFAFDATSTSLQLINGGKLKPLAVTGSRRDSHLPDVPTFAELGYPDLTSDIFFGLLAPAAAPQAIIDRLAVAMRNAAAEPAVQQALTGSGNKAESSSPEAFRALIDKESNRWKKVIDQLGITP